MTHKLRAFDAVTYLDSDAMTRAYLAAAFEDGDSRVIRAALNDIVRAKGITTMAETTGMPRASIYKALGDDGNPTLETLLALTKALGFRLSLAA